MPILTKQRLYCAKVEGTLGTTESITASEGAMNVEEMAKQNNTTFTSINAQNGLGKRPGVIGAKPGTHDIMVYACGLGSSGLPYWAELLKGCGGAFTSQTFAPVANNGVGLTCALFRGSTTTARCHKIAGAMANAVFTFRAGEVVPVRFSLMGKHITVATQTVPTVTHPTVIPPRFVSATFTIGGDTFQIDELEFDMGNQVIMREDPTDATGFRSAWIADRAPRVRISPEATPLATKDWEAIFNAGTTAALSVVLGATTNNIITLAAPAIQLIAPPNDGERNGILTDVLEFSCNQNADTEDSEYTIVFS